MNLREYVSQHAVRGACTCGKCIDAPPDAKKLQPEGHTVDLTFFKVAATEKAHDKDFFALVQKEYPHWLDGKEHSYIEIGGDLGDQGLALMTIGLGHVLGVWKVLCPETMMPMLPDDMKMQMAQRGLVSLQAKAEQ